MAKKGRGTDDTFLDPHFGQVCFEMNGDSYRLNHSRKRRATAAD